jgi:hypothetical protein
VDLNALNLELVFIPCPICGSVSHAPFRFIRGFSIVQCSDCRFIFVNPRPAEKDLSRLYDQQDDNPYFAERHEPFAYEFPTLAQVVRALRRLLTHGDLLEVGCGRGDLLRVAQGEGFSVTGCDIFGGRPPVIPGARFVDSSLSQARFPDHSFDVVVMTNMTNLTGGDRGHDGDVGAGDRGCRCLLECG